MSNQRNTVLKNVQFAKRFADVCNTSKPSDAAKILGISYQAAKNYLSGKVPNTLILIKIAKETSCSIDWLLLGKGEKFIESDPQTNTPLLSDQLREFIRSEVKTALEEVPVNQSKTAKEKVIVLKPEFIREEKVLDESPILPLKKE